MPQLAAGTCLRSQGEGEQDPEAAKPPFAGSNTCLASQAWEVPPEVEEASKGASPSPSSPCRCAYWGGTAPQQLCLSQAPTPPSNTHLPTQTSTSGVLAPPCACTHRPQPPPPLPPACPLPPRVLSGRSGLRTRTRLHSSTPS